MARSHDIDDKAIERVARDLGLPDPEAPAAAAPVQVDRPTARPRIDLGDIDRYLESLSK